MEKTKTKASRKKNEKQDTNAGKEKAKYTDVYKGENKDIEVEDFCWVPEVEKCRETKGNKTNRNSRRIPLMTFTASSLTFDSS